MLGRHHTYVHFPLSLLLLHPSAPFPSMPALFTPCTPEASFHFHYISRPLPTPFPPPLRALNARAQYIFSGLLCFVCVKNSFFPAFSIQISDVQKHRNICELYSTRESRHATSQNSHTSLRASLSLLILLNNFFMRRNPTPFSYFSSDKGPFSPTEKRLSRVFFLFPHPSHPDCGGPSSTSTSSSVPLLLVPPSSPLCLIFPYDILRRGRRGGLGRRRRRRPGGKHRGAER